MKKVFKTFAIAFTLILFYTFLSYAQNNDKGKSHYTKEEIKQMCSVPVDLEEMKKVLAKQDSMYNDYSSKKRLRKTTSIPNWQSMMSSIENQGTCGSCWVHAATGAIEGQLHILYGSNIGVDLDESAVPNACSGGFPSSAEGYVSTNKINSEVSSYPNLQGVK
jgi:C1A family cysteine protease